MYGGGTVTTPRTTLTPFTRIWFDFTWFGGKQGQVRAERPVGCPALCAVLTPRLHAASARTSTGARNNTTNRCRSSHRSTVQVNHRNVEAATVAHQGSHLALPCLWTRHGRANGTAHTLRACPSNR